MTGRVLKTSRALAFAILLLPTTLAAADGDVRFTVELPAVLLADVPVPRVKITALTEDGRRDPHFQGAYAVRGLEITRNGEPIPWGDFDNGVLERTSDAARDITIRATGDPVIIEADPGSSTSQQPRIVPGWWALVPPAMAILLAILLREVVAALFIAVLTGGLILWSSPWDGARHAIETILVGQIIDAGQAQIILFTMFLGAMIGVMSAGGGTAALVSLVTRFAKRREHGQVSTWLMGLVVFFDDYANTLLVGSTMRPVADRLRFSREKLAFLVDSTAAPVAGLSIISTWVGVEMSHIQTSFENLDLPTADLYWTFLATIPYRIYPLLLLGFVLMIAWTGRDFGPMLAAERRIQNDEREQDEVDGQDQSKASLAGLTLAFLPLAVLLGGIAFGITPDNSTQVLMLASCGASIAAVLCVVTCRTLSLTTAMEAWIDGLKSMLPAIVILVLAWSVATVCDASHLNTAGYVVHLVGDALAAKWVPAVTFLIAASVSFATGSSYATMGLLMPLFVALLHSLLPYSADQAAAEIRDPLMLGTIGAVLAGSIFGDHCSPISDTTVLSSAASGCDHLRHVATQMPYAVTVGTVTVGIGYVPLAFGPSPWFFLPCGFLVLWSIVRLIGRRCQA